MSISIIESRKRKLSEADLSQCIKPINDSERAELQRVLLNMYKDVLLVCKKYDLIPFLCGGSALGAVRHHGFIPWDDDLDIAMTRSDFNTLVKVFRGELSEKYILNAPNYSADAKARFPKIIRKGTVFQEIGTVTAPGLNGVFLDIFIIDNVPDNLLIRNVKGLACNIIEFISSCVYDYENLDDLAKRFHKKSGIWTYYIRMTIGKVCSIIPSSNWFHAVDKIIRWGDEHSRDCTIAQGRGHYFGEILPRDTVFPPSYRDYCDIKAPLFHDVNYYLSNLYGDYMTVPPEDKREQHFIKVLKI